jgi:CO/xanthine dehydrogenase Mo-binding subunit
MTLPSPSLVANPDLDTWIRVDEADTITVFTGRVELGQGLRAAMRRIAADELDLPLAAVRVETADTARGPDEGWTAGSMSMADGGTAMRQAAAEAREHLLRLAAAALDASPAQLRVRDGVVTAPDGQTTSYWEVLGGGRFGFRIEGDAAPRPPQEYRHVGKPGPRADLEAIVAGTLTYVQDLRLPGMLFGRVVRPPSPAAVFESVGTGPARALPGVVAVVCDGGFLAVVAQREEQADRAADALRAAARWAERPSLPAERDLFDWLRAQPGEDFLVLDGAPVDGPVPPIETPEGAATTLQATFTRPYQMHASIGPAAAAARWEADGSVTAWSAAQGPFVMRAALAQVLGLEPEQVRVIHVEGPGCYGHNGAEDATLDAVLVARAAPGRPVLVKWSREDEHAWEPYGPPMVVQLQASLDADGNLLDWNHDVRGTTHVTRASPHGERTSLLPAWYLARPVPRQPARPLLAPHAGLHRNADPLYAVPRRRVVKHFVEEMPLRTSAMRSLGAYANVFAIESFVDELSEAAGRDPLEYRLAYLTDERARAVLAAASEHAGWRGRSREPGRGMGMGFARYKNAAAYAAVFVEATVDDATAVIALERIVIAADAGQVVDPDGLVNQLEGGAVQSASWTLREQVRFDRTRVRSVDWETYPILGFRDVPELETVLIDRPGAPYLGAGEATQGPTAGAIANAVYDAIGVRLRDLPFTPDNVRAAVARAS